MVSGFNSCRQLDDLELFFRGEYGRTDHYIRNHLLDLAGNGLDEHIRYIEEYGVTVLRGLFTSLQMTDMQADVEAWRAWLSGNDFNI